MASQEIAFCRNVLFLSFPFFSVRFSGRDQEQGETKWLFNEPGCGMQLLSQVGETAKNRRQGRWTCVQKMVLNKEVWSCKVLLGKLLTFLQVKGLKELQSQAPGKWRHTPKINTSAHKQAKIPGAGRKASAMPSVPIFLNPVKDAEIAQRRADIVVTVQQHLPGH